MLANLRTLIALYRPHLRLQRYKTIFKSTTLMSIKQFLIVHFNFLGVCEASYTPIAEQLQQTKTSESQDCFIAISALTLPSRIPRPTCCRYFESDSVGRANCMNSTSGKSAPSERMSTFTTTSISPSRYSCTSRSRSAVGVLASIQQQFTPCPHHHRHFLRLVYVFANA